MKEIISAVLAAVVLSTGVVLAEESKPIKLTAEQMDTITAGDLVLPNGHVQFAAFDNAAPAPVHPSFFRSPTAGAKQVENGYSGPTATQPVNEGPWSAAAQSPVITCVDSAGFGVGGICPAP